MQPINFRALYPRLLNFGIGFGDLERISSTAADWPSFSHAMANLAKHWEESANELPSGQIETSRQYWLQAAAYYHYAQIKLSDSSMKEDLRAASRRCYEKYAALADPAAIRCEIPFMGTSLPGYLRVKDSGAPCIILIGGLDSAKEVELHHFAEAFLRRSCSVFYFDGPGQGELYRKVSLRTGFEHVIATVIDFLLDHSSVGSAPIGCFGVALGGYFACRAAACDGRIGACISIGGFFDSTVLCKLPPLAQEMFLRAFGFLSTDDIAAVAPYITLAPLHARLKAPLLLVHGTADHLVDMTQIKALQDWAGGPVDTLIFEGSEHVCCDRFNESLPRMGDWMRNRLLHKNAPQLVLV